ncbi:MAG: hypothetical protein WCF67_12745 [Chitinophagaceae bacterium]
MKPILLLVALTAFISSYVFSQRSIVIEPENIPAYNPDVLLKKLESFHSKKKTDSLIKFFADWNRAISPTAKASIIQNDTIKSLYDIHYAFYKPRDLLKLGNWEWGNKLNESSKYVVVSTSINYVVLDTDNIGDAEIDLKYINTIFNFRPIVADIDNTNVLYLTGEYQNALNRFLGNKYADLGTGNIMDPAMPKGESEKRYRFLRPYIPILHGHWGGYWHIETHPDISRIVFNKQLTKARIYFRVGYQGGEATMIKMNGEWKLEKSKETWIE